MGLLLGKQLIYHFVTPRDCDVYRDKIFQRQPRCFHNKRLNIFQLMKPSNNQIWNTGITHVFISVLIFYLFSFSKRISSQCLESHELCHFILLPIAKYSSLLLFKSRAHSSISSARHNQLAKVYLRSCLLESVREIGDTLCLTAVLQSVKSREVI